MGRKGPLLGPEAGVKKIGAHSRSLSMKQVLIVAAPEKYRDEELLIPQEALTSKRAAVTTASTRAGKITGMFGSSAQAVALKDVAGINYDALLVAGGAGCPATLWEEPLLREMIRRHHESGKVVGAICLGGVALAKAGVLSGVEATVFKTEASMKAYSQCGVNFREAPVVHSGNIITANGPAAARQFALAVASLLSL